MKGGSSNGGSVFFSNIPYDTSAGYLRRTFSEAGQVRFVELYTTKEGRSIGAGLVYFSEPEAADKAVSLLDGIDVDGRQMAVKVNNRVVSEGNPDARVFFNGIPFTTTKGFLKAKFEPHGEIVDFDLWRNFSGSSLGKGTCEFFTPTEAEAAVAALDGTVVDGRQISVQMDFRPEESREDSGPQSSKGKGKSAKGGKGESKGKGAPPPLRGGGFKGGKGGGSRVFWSNVPVETNEGYLRSKFEKVGTIVDFDFWRRDDGTSLGKGTVEFDHYLGAWRALERLHETEIDGSTMLIKMDNGGRK